TPAAKAIANQTGSGSARAFRYWPRSAFQRSIWSTLKTANSTTPRIARPTTDNAAVLAKRPALSVPLSFTSSDHPRDEVRQLGFRNEPHDLIVNFAVLE